ncbi:hypothetical protein ACLOJK_013763 [Asimina triloba]
MDGDLIKHEREDQMDMMMMMIPMDKLPEYCSVPFSDVGELPLPLEFAAGATSTAPPSFDPISANSRALVNHPPSLPFLSNSLHEPATPSLFSDTMVGRLRNAGDMSSAATGSLSPEQKRNSVAAMREMIFRIAVMQPVHIDPESIKPPKRRNVKISKDPQSVAARHRRERISERIRILQRLVPGGTKMDTASMLDEAIHYVKFLKNQVQSLERVASNRNIAGHGLSAAEISNMNFSSIAKGYQPSQIFQPYTTA